MAVMFLDTDSRTRLISIMVMIASRVGLGMWVDMCVDVEGGE